MRRALAVDDEAVSRIVLARMLETIGFQPSQASDVPTALELIQSSPFELVVADYLMPSGTGLELAEAAIESGAAFILLTGFASDTTIDDPRVGLVHAHLTKPASSHELAEAVTQAIGLPHGQ